MGVHGLKAQRGSPEMKKHCSRDLDLLGSSTQVAAVVDLLTRLFSLWDGMARSGSMTIANLLYHVKRYVDRLFDFFEVVGICVDYGSPASKGVEQDNRKKRSHALPLGAQEEIAVLDQGVLFDITRVRASRNVYHYVRTIIVEYLITEYTIPDKGVGQRLYIMAHPQEPDAVHIVESDGKRYSRQCIPVREGDGQTLLMTECIGLPTVLISNDLDVFMMLLLRMTLKPGALPSMLYHMRCDERFATFMSSWSNYKPTLEPQPPPAMNAKVQVVDMFGYDSVVAKQTPSTGSLAVQSSSTGYDVLEETDMFGFDELLVQHPMSGTQSEPQPKPQTEPKPKTSSVYETPFMDINGVMAHVFTSRKMTLHYVWLGFMFGCDYVHAGNWIKGVSADYTWNRWNESIEWVRVVGDGPYRVLVNSGALMKFIEGVINSKGSLRDHPPGPCEGRKKRPDLRMYRGTIRRTLWTMLYMINGPYHPEGVPSSLQQIDGTSVWGWRRLGHKVRETNVVTTEVPEQFSS